MEGVALGHRAGRMKESSMNFLLKSKFDYREGRSRGGGMGESNQERSTIGQGGNCCLSETVI